MGKHDQVSAAAEEARRATGGAAGRGRGGRFSARRKRETVLRLLRGEDLESVSRELGVTATASRAGCDYGTTTAPTTSLTISSRRSPSSASTARRASCGSPKATASRSASSAR